MKNKNNRKFSVDRAHPMYRLCENIVVKVKLAISIVLALVALLLLIFDVALPLWVYILFVVVLFGVPAILRKVLHKKFGIN